MTSSAVGNRLDRRKARTRAALITAARELLTTRDPAAVSIQEITDAADVGFGSFHNHFTSKQQLFDLAVAEAAQEHSALIEAVTAGLTDPAEAFAVAVRVTALFPQTRPGLARVIDRAGVRYLECAPVLAARALGHLRHAKDIGRFCYDDPAVALACAGGAVLGALHLSLDTEQDPTEQDPAEQDPAEQDPAEQDPAERGPGGRGLDATAEALALSLLRMFGVPEPDARRLSTRTLPTVRDGWL